jgi:hypothetical protein
MVRPPAYTQEELANFRDRGGRIKKVSPGQAKGADSIARWRGSFYPVIQGPGELKLDEKVKARGNKRRRRK